MLDKHLHLLEIYNFKKKSRENICRVLIKVLKFYYNNNISEVRLN